MKKLMIAACAAAMAMGANAETHEWSFKLSNNESMSVCYDGYKATTVNGMSANAVDKGFSVYWISAGLSAKGADHGTVEASGVAFLKSLRAGKTFEDALKDNKMAVLASTTTGENGLVATVKADVDTSFYYADGGENYLSVLLAIMGDDAKNFVMLGDCRKRSETDKSFTAGATFTKYLRDNDGTVGYSTTIGSGWYSTVPEPTSGLLMLMGGMLLGLRRKRA